MMAKQQSNKTVPWILGMGGALTGLWWARRQKRLAATPLAVLLGSGVVYLARSVGRERNISCRQAVTIACPEEAIHRILSDSRSLQHVLPGELLLEDQNNGLKVRGSLLQREFEVRVFKQESDHHMKWEAPLPFAQLSGTVALATAPGERGTEVHARVDYRPSAPVPKPGLISRTAIQLALRKTLNRLRAYVETGEIPTIKGQITGRGEHALADVRELPKNVGPDRENGEQKEVGT